MKTSEIEVGATYSNGNGEHRRVTVCDRTTTTEYVTVKSGRFLTGKRKWCKTSTFARWAKERVQ